MIRFARHARALRPALAGAALLAVVGCQTKTTTTRTTGPAEPARRAAQSFVHCVESDGGTCVKRDPTLGSWDAFALLEWLGSGTPTSILQALRRELQHHRDLLAIQDRFVAKAARFREPLRGAECKPESAKPFAELLPSLSARVETRLESLGLWREDLAGVVEGLSAEAEEGLGDGWIVHMTCYGEPYELWVATSKRDERQVVVGMLLNLPTWLGGTVPNEEQVEGRIRSRTAATSTTLGVVREGTVDSTWVPLPIEEF